MWAFTLLICLETSFVVETHRSVEQPELEGLAEVVTHGPVLNHPPVLEPPDVDLLGCELPPSRLPAEELAGVASMHHDPSDDLFPSQISSSTSKRIGPQSSRSQATVAFRPSGPCGLPGGASWLTNCG